MIKQLKNKKWPFILDILFPPRCIWCEEVVPIGEKICPKCTKKLQTIKLPYTNFRPHENYYLACAWAVYIYQYPVRDAILRFKFEGEKSLYKMFAHQMALDAISNQLNQMYDVVIPVPLSPKRMHARSYNQSALLAKQVAGLLNMPYSEVNLIKVVETAKQMESNAIERKTNVKNAFAVQNKIQLLGKNILLIDDIITTGNTLEECAKVLIQAGANACGALCLSSAFHGKIID